MSNLKKYTSVLLWFEEWENDELMKTSSDWSDQRGMKSCKKGNINSKAWETREKKRSSRGVVFWGKYGLNNTWIPNFGGNIEIFKNNLRIPKNWLVIKLPYILLRFLCDNNVELPSFLD